MSTVHEIEAAVPPLSPQGLAGFSDWLWGVDEPAWDQQLEADVRAGRLDALADEVIRDLREGRCRDL